MFCSKEELEQHSKVHDVHNLMEARLPKEIKTTQIKRKFVEEDVTPIVEAMSADMTQRHKAVYDGPSKSFSIGQSRKRGKMEVVSQY
jgi:hypothetical protein